MYVKIRRHQHTRVHAHTGPRLLYFIVFPFSLFGLPYSRALAKSHSPTTPFCRQAEGSAPHCARRCRAWRLVWIDMCENLE